VFIDETWTKTNMAPLRGWAPRGQRIKAKVPHGRWQTMTFMAALRHDRITAPWFIEGPINGETFLLYIEKVLAPTLRHGDIVIMDNLGSHKANAAPSVPPAPGSSTCRSTRPISTRSSSSSPSSNTGCAKPRSQPPRPSTMLSLRSSTPSHRPNAPITSPTPDMTKPKLITL
jgi:DDE superfamily endonuclease